MASGDAARPTFDFRAVASVGDGKQRITAKGPDASDAIEKPVTVHPDGEEKTQTSATVFGDAGALDLNVPAGIVANSLRGELKIYPNLAAHVLEGVEGIMQRPYGCGEQTISSAYPSVLVLNYAEASGRGRGSIEPRVAVLARRYTREGYERLLGYRAPEGGFTYWGRGEPDLALTAYALRFLTDASGVIEVDEAVIKETREWLVRQQHVDGSWSVYNWDGAGDKRLTALTTAYIARVLARTSKGTPATEPASTGKALNGNGRTSNGNGKTLPPLARALRYLAERVEEVDEPHLIASYALAWLDAGERAGAARAIEKLRALAHDEGAATYWSLETNTPFYGWGLAGRIETTALAVPGARALRRRRGRESVAATATAASARHGRARHRGSSSSSARRIATAWFDQATVNVLDTLLSLVADVGGRRPRVVGSQNTRAVPPRSSSTVVARARLLAARDELSAPLIFDLTPFVAAGDNRVEIRRAGHAAQAQGAGRPSLLLVRGRKSSETCGLSLRWRVDSLDEATARVTSGSRSASTA